MYSESVCQVARSWVDVGSFHTRLVVRFMIFTASVRNILAHNMQPTKSYKCTQLTPKTASVVPPEDGRLTPGTCTRLRQNKVLVIVQ
jgi:hypothetical protein